MALSRRGGSTGLYRDTATSTTWDVLYRAKTRFQIGKHAKLFIEPYNYLQYSLAAHPHHTQLLCSVSPTTVSRLCFFKSRQDYNDFCAIVPIASQHYCIFASTRLYQLKGRDVAAHVRPSKDQKAMQGCQALSTLGRPGAR
ncbi:hypothetical protein C8R44DRAFT_740739 [Mycena epipterygia]|nr:hypothetical protein C8R44DRAFT_740739 [Mycena epipterygia]